MEVKPFWSEFSLFKEISVLSYVPGSEVVLPVRVSYFSPSFLATWVGMVEQLWALTPVAVAASSAATLVWRSPAEAAAAWTPCPRSPP